MSRNAMAPFDPTSGSRSSIISIVELARQVDIRLGSTPDDTETDYQSIIKLSWVPAHKLWYDRVRQRYTQPDHMKKLSEDWNLLCVTPAHGRYDPEEDRYYVSDGAHHITQWVRTYGEDCLVPMCYVVSTDPAVSSTQFLALNNDSEPMAKYFIHEQKCLLGDTEAMALEKTVTDANCITAYTKRCAGAITHMTDLHRASKDYGNTSLGTVLAKYRLYWPSEKVHTATLLGLLEVKKLMELASVYDDHTFNELLYQLTRYFESADRLHRDIKDEFKVLSPTNYKALGAREKVASGIINVHYKQTGCLLADPPFEIDMPMIED